MKQCFRCQQELRADAKFCDNCGANQYEPNHRQATAPSSTSIRCARCNAASPLGTYTCYNCGNDLTYRHNPQAKAPPVSAPRKRNGVIAPMFVGFAVVATCAVLAYIVDANRPTPRQDAVAMDVVPVATTVIPRKDYREFDVRAIAKDPESYHGVGIRLVGEVLDIEQDNGQTVMQIWVQHPGGDEFDREAVIVVYDGTSSGLYEKDTVYVWGEGGGTFEGTNAFGGTIRQPVILADEISY